MTAEVSCGDEIGECGLFHQRGVTAGDRKRGGKAIHEVMREHEIAEAERREENFAEASGEENQAVAVETLERGDGASCVAEFAVVIVFQNQRAGFASGFEQLEAAGKAHRDSEGKLVTGCDVDE